VLTTAKSTEKRRKSSERLAIDSEARAIGVTKNIAAYEVLGSRQSRNRIGREHTYFKIGVNGEKKRQQGPPE